MSEPDDKGTDSIAGVASAARSVDARLLEVLVCPVTKASLDYDRDRGELISRGARLAFPIRDGVPLMVVDAARQLGPDE